MDSEARFADVDLDMVLRGVQDNDKWVSDDSFCGRGVCAGGTQHKPGTAVELGRVSRVVWTKA